MTSQTRVMTYRRGTMTQLLLSVMYVLLLLNWLAILTQAEKVKRLCKNRIDVLSNEGVYIEPYEKSRVEIELAKYRVNKRNVIKFEFRTKVENGVLFFGRRRKKHDELLALRLVGGDFYYKIHCPTASADVRFPFQSKLNDSKWHKVVVRFRSKFRKIQIEVDGKRNFKAYDFSCALPNSLFIGGVNPHDNNSFSKIVGDVPHFEGCIREVNTPWALAKPPRYYAISTCE